jgi:hypothetical protein
LQKHGRRRTVYSAGLKAVQAQDPETDNKTMKRINVFLIRSEGVHTPPFRLNLTHNSGYAYTVPLKEDLPQSRKSKRRKEGKKKGPVVPNSRERMAKEVQVLSNLNENFFDFAVKKFCGSSLAFRAGLLIFLFLVSVFCLPAQERGSDGETFDFIIPEPEKPPLAPENPAPLPRQYRGVSLGMGLEDLKETLQKDELFNYRGDKDVSFLPVKEETLVETTGLSFIRRAFFQLKEGRVFIMAFTLDTRFIDHYSVFTAMVKKYGEPQSLSPAESVWESEEIRVSIERPLTVKYIDKTVFNQLLEESRSLESRQLLFRQEFIDDF